MSNTRALNAPGDYIGLSIDLNARHMARAHPSTTRSTSISLHNGAHARSRVIKTAPSAVHFARESLPYDRSPPVTARFLEHCEFAIDDLGSLRTFIELSIFDTNPVRGKEVCVITELSRDTPFTDVLLVEHQTSRHVTKPPGEGAYLQ